MKMKNLCENCEKRRRRINEDTSMSFEQFAAKLAFLSNK